jgi:Mlc titration factor MtfA (ptsG expression regulator)
LLFFIYFYTESTGIKTWIGFKNQLMILAILTVVLSVFIFIAIIFGFLNTIVEPIYIGIFKKPIYIYFYPIIKKLPQPQKLILERNVIFYNRLSTRKKKYFEHRMTQFLTTYQIYGKDGLIVTDEMKTMIAATYVMLTFGIRQYLIDVFDKIILYPTSYYSTVKKEWHNGEFNPHYKVIAFSWKHFKEGYEAGNDNLNLGIHEFAHALHFHGMKKRDNGAAIFAEMYDKIRKEVKQPANAKRLTDSHYFRIYAFTNEFEFLAVILEHFFETPQVFKNEFPELYINVQQMINYTPN